MTSVVTDGPATPTASDRRRRRRWDGARWMLRVGIASTPVLAAAVWSAGPRDRILTIALLCAAWVPLISLSQWASGRFRGPVTTIATVVIDLAALLVVGELAPSLAPVLAVLVAVVAAVYGQDLRTGLHLLTALAAVAVQVALLAGQDAGPLVAAIVTLDVVAIATVSQQMAERTRDRRRSSAAINRADQLTDAVLTGIGEAVVVTDAAGRITSANGAAETTFGRAATGRCDVALALQHGAGQLDCSVGCPLVDPETGVGQADVSRAHPNGTKQALLVNARAVRDPLGRIREVVHSYRDITAIKQAEHAKTLFLATASHELKTPLAVITGFVDLLDNDAVPADRRRAAIDTIRSRGQQLTAIIDRLLLASRIDGGGLTLSTAPTDLVSIVTDRVAALQEVTGRTITLDLPDEPVPAVDGEATALATVIDHLVENAVKYSPDGGSVEVTVRTGATTVDVDVADHGVGMTAAAAEQCFDAFWQAESIDARRFGGSGVGLYIVRSLSRAMGGDTIVARSTPGDGTTFRFQLVRSDAVRHVAAPQEQSASAVDDVLRQVGVGKD